jgi:hypothetical protein
MSMRPTYCNKCGASTGSGPFHICDDEPTIPLMHPKFQAGKRSFGSLTSEDVGRKVSFSEPGLHLSGKLKHIKHEIAFRGEPETELWISFEGGGFTSLKRPPSATVDLTD